ncbi:MAG: 50S ribosomal protein L4 [Candidatus Terrybacteria bacterium RIFCSPLOWO2_02_42_20]|uniref:50S ribosomal protein L4 n=1 Tax=Candidatus Terrybacteria bacterium RIFCSPLOWO2_02_42_20 TaxID=1802370 RepID=A0A1G2Q271_9BACT|nr:MAG: 50S ribosomal protein L4 [Candidatus Terrybacteria bacterium RIFCSPLOWO2_02_42_20]
MDFSQPKTKEAVEVVNSLSKIGGFEKMKNKKKNKAILALDKKEPNVSKSFRNIPGMEIYQARNLNILDILNFKYLVIANPKEAISGWK